jgi:hypothetical protein
LVQIEPLVLVDYQPGLKGVWQGVARVGLVPEDLVSVGISNWDYKSTYIMFIPQLEFNTIFYLPKLEFIPI